MQKKLLFILCSILGTLGFSQTITIGGKIIGSEKKIIENTTIYLLKQKDSSIINYTNSNKEGYFKLKLNPVNEPTILKIEQDKSLPYNKNFSKITENIELGEIELERKLEKTIEEVKITASPVKIKKDTIEFNASNIKVRPDSKIEEMLKQIPGVEIDNDGKITINGKDVDKILVNGKPFFDKDGKIALKNLPAELIKNIQFTTTKTKEEELSGKIAKSNTATINFNIDEKKNKGFMSRLTAGYGSDKRYEGSLISSYFKNKTKVSILASSNNINSQGFSNDEVMDSMGNGRNSWLLKGGSVSYMGNSTYYQTDDTQKKGILKSNILGFNYSDKIGNQLEIENFGLMYLDSNQETRSKVNKTTFLPDYNLQSLYENEGENDNQQLEINQEIVLKTDSLTSIYFRPGFSVNRFQKTNKNASLTYKNNLLLNDNKTYEREENSNQSFNPSIYFTKKLNSKGREISLSTSNTFAQNNTSNTTISETNFYQGSGLPNDNRNQFSKRKKTTQNNSYGMEYTEPITDSIKISIGIDYDEENNKNQVAVNDFDNIAGNYNNYNQLLSNTIIKKEQTFAPSLSMEMSKEKLSLWAGAYFNINKLSVESEFQNQKILLEKDNFIPNTYFGFNYSFSDTGRLNIYQNTSYQTPTSEQLSLFTNYTNPLISIVGNPNLKNAWNSYTNFYLSNSNIQKGTNYYISGGFQYSNNSITTTSFYDDYGKQQMSYDNISGRKYVRLSLGYTKTYKWNDNKSKFTISPRLSQNYVFSKGYINGEIFSSEIYSLSPGINLGYEAKDKMTIKPSYSLSYNNSQYKNYFIDKANATVNQFKIELTNYFFKTNLVVGNDFEYNTNSIIQPGYKKDYYFWNTSIGYAFYNKQLTAKVKVYDVLNQNQAISRNITSTFVEDREDLILKRYIMFSLTMKLNKFGGKK